MKFFSPLLKAIIAVEDDVIIRHRHNFPVSPPYFSHGVPWHRNGTSADDLRCSSAENCTGRYGRYCSLLCIPDSLVGCFLKAASLNFSATWKSIPIFLRAPQYEMWRSDSKLGYQNQKCDRMPNPSSRFIPSLSKQSVWKRVQISAKQLSCCTNHDQWCLITLSPLLQKKAKVLAGLAAKIDWSKQVKRTDA